jgi:hypothetical protein
MQRFGSLLIRARTTHFPERPKKSFVDGIGDSGFFPLTLKFSFPICRLRVKNNNKSQGYPQKFDVFCDFFCLFLNI